MADENTADPDEQSITYTIASLGPERWFVDSNRGTSGYSFRSFAEAERFAITLAQRNTPCRVCVLSSDGLVVTEMIFNQPTDTGR